MCGIAGLVGFCGDDPQNTGKLDAIMDHFAQALAHRGPDGEGRYRRHSCLLVHTRLAIVDVAGGAQPFVSRAGQEDEIALIANGEIYNDPVLRQKMPGTDFATLSDCEPALHLYRDLGLDYVDQLRGMYAIAIWDEARERLVLSRDPFGIKTLYYAPTPSGFAFASEPAALLGGSFVGAVLNERKRDELLQLQFTTGTETAFAGIHKVAPGETIVVEKGAIVARRHRPAVPQEGPRAQSRTAALTQLDSVLNDTVEVHQRADVPYGMFLSGGIDSTVLLAMMNRLNDRPVMAFTAGFSGTDVPDERAHARALAKAQNADHIEVEFGERDFWSELPAIVRHMDDPVADYALLPTWKLAQTAHREGIKVVLSGEGGDELFAGYGRYRSAKRWLFAKDMYRTGILDGLGVLRTEDPARAWRAGIAQAEISTRVAGQSRLQGAQAVDISTWLAGDLLPKIDRMLMAHGVEGRVPFLDPKLAEFAFTLPDRFKIRRGLGKFLLRDWLSTALPGARPFAKKRGFTVPVGAWIAGQGGRAGDAVARQEAILQICKPDVVKDLFAGSVGRLGGRAGKAAWTLLFYALWHKIHVQNVPAEGDVFDVLGS